MERSSREKEVLEKAIRILKKHLVPEKIILFGSRGKGENGKASDFDLAVDQERPEIDKERLINEEIERIAGLYHVDVVYLKSVDIEFRELVFKTGKIIYERRN